MSFLDIKDPAKKATLVKEYVTAMKTVKQRNMVNRELKLAIGDELQTLFHPIVNATKQAAEETRKELEPMKKTLADIVGALNRSAPQSSKIVDNTFGIYIRGDGKLVMGNKIVEIDENKKILTVDGREYDLTPGVRPIITKKHPQPSQWSFSDYQVYKSLCQQTKVRSHLNPEGAARPHATWKYKHMLKKMVVPGEKIVEEEYEESKDTDTASIGDSSSISFRKSRSGPPSVVIPPPSPAHTHPYGKINKLKLIGPPYIFLNRFQ